MKKCVIFSALIEGYGDWIADVAKGCYVICADKGYAYAKELDVKTDLLVGDFDSYDGEMPDEDLVEIIRVSPEKDDTDTGLCLKEALKRGYKDITIIGGVGGRLSHTMANIQSMAKTATKAEKMTMTDGLRKVTVLHGPASMKLEEGKDFPENYEDNPKHYVSLFAHGGDCKDVTVMGTFYPLVDASLTCDYPLGVSNELTQREATITIKKGTLIVIAE